MSHPVACAALVKLHTFYQGELQESNHLTISALKIISNSDVHPVVQRTLKRLHDAISKSFFIRYCHDIAPSYGHGVGKPSESQLLEMVSVMHPTYKKLACMNNVVKSKIPSQFMMDAKIIVAEFKEKVHGKVLNLVNRVYMSANDNYAELRSLLSTSKHACRIRILWLTHFSLRL